VDEPLVIKDAAREIDHRPTGGRPPAPDDCQPDAVATTDHEGHGTEALTIRPDDRAATQPARRGRLGQDSDREAAVRP
jgi:hypothetical protein